VAFVDNQCSCEAPAGATALFAVRDLNFAASPARGRMMRCPACGALFPDVFPAAEALPAAYGGYYTAAKGRGRPRAFRRAYLDRATPTGARRILDYGCGAGDYLARMAAARPNARLFGTDLVRPQAASLGYAWIGPDQIEAAGSFDWITLGHVIEHVPAPAELLARLARTLTPGGGLWIATPSAESFLFRAAGPWARDVDFPRHREIFSRRGLERLLADAGLTATFVPAPRLNAILNTLSTARNILGDRDLRWARRILKAWATTLALACHLLKPKSRREPESPELIVLCRRPA